MSIREIQQGDLDLLVQLCEEHAEYERSVFHPDGQAERLQEALFSQPPRLFAWILELNDEGAGFASASFEYSTWDAREYLHLDCIYLRASARGGGWGSKLLAVVEAHATQHGCRQMQWQTPPWNEKAIAFYEAKGASSLPKLRFSRPIPATHRRSRDPNTV